VTLYPQAWVDAVSSSGVVLASWVGRQGPLEIRRTVFFGERDVIIYMHTTIMNIGSSKVFDVRYLRSIDPDQEQPWNSDATSYVTNNYVKYQYQSSYTGACLSPLSQIVPRLGCCVVRHLPSRLV